MRSLHSVWRVVDCGRQAAAVYLANHTHVFIGADDITRARAALEPSKS